MKKEKETVLLSWLDGKYSAYIAKAEGKLKNCLLSGLRFINWKNYVRKGSTVFVKPNLTFPRHVEGVTTTPELLRNLLQIIRGRCSNIIVGESDGGDHSYSAEDAFEGHGLYKICKSVGARLVNLSRLPSRFVESEVQGKRITVQLPRMLLEEVDCFISVPVLKVHVVTWVSLGLKNLWGCYPDTMRGLYHRNLDRKLALIAKILNPKITIIDGLYALDRHGPMFGNPVKMDLVLMSNNTVVADALGSKVIGIPLRKTKHIMTAENEGIGTSNLKNVRINANWADYQKEFHVKRTFLDMFSVLTFDSYIVSKVVADSPFTSMIYGIVDKLRSPKEKEIATQLKTKKRIDGN